LTLYGRDAAIIPAMMPYIDTQVPPHKTSDRPLVVPPNAEQALWL